MSSIQAIAAELALNVDEQARVWRRLLELSMTQHEALRTQDVHTVHGVLQEIEVTMLERSRTEVRRGVLLAQAAAVLGVPSDSLTRDVISAHCDPATAERLRVAAEELRSLIVELDAIVHRNSTLLEQELSIIEVMVKGATVDTTQRATYGKQGTQTEAPRLRLLDAQV